MALNAEQLGEMCSKCYVC